jgi:UDP-N-acetylmuramoylalanine--D-glutamate ligase
MQEAVERASAAADSGDVVLLAPACASFDWYNGFEERGRAFKDAVAKLAVQARFSHRRGAEDAEKS